MAGAIATAPPGPLVSLLVVALVVVGSFFLTVGTIGLLRLPNVYNRLHATSKATTLGASGIALAAWAYFGPGGAGMKALVTVLFLFLTAPTGGHMISRAAQRMGVEFEEGVTWPGRVDETPEQPADGNEHD
ncbi:multicomponent Na+:H+ antiporter subunit G [Halobaculum gomorrense]|uniref:Multicomponent Na+:H+ antiporter subunit G n=2 Tax=Halobaculum gomorrense TaxID=43928 RepID=A0A1M5P8H4_9EURY|nr:monovalent cation/H(+) antiporter subunit G [Halobaculum gomorrense]SHG98114.1 multicomponent Na+:H+ antiporter subunit G [Halobaculum gomorrense]